MAGAPDDKELERRFRQTSLASPERNFAAAGSVYPLSHNSRFKGPIRNLVYETFDRNRVGVGKDAKGLHHKDLEVINIYRLEDKILFGKYWNYRKSIAGQRQRYPGSFKSVEDLPGGQEIKTTEQADYILAKRFDARINECYLFHGTSYENAQSILRTGFNTRCCSKYSLFGQAIYLAESSSKADQYADDRNNRVPYGESLYMIIAKVCLGRTYICQSGEKFQRPPCIKLSCCSDTCDVHPPFHSVIGTHKYDESELLFREFVIYDGRACFPEFVVEYKRVGRK